VMILVDGLIVDRVAVSSSIMSTRVGEYRTAAVIFWPCPLAAVVPRSKSPPLVLNGLQICSA
jgi:hypothetical protein